MEIRDQEVDAKSDTETQVGGRYTLALPKFMSFCSSSIILGVGETGGEVWAREKHKRS